MTFDIDNASIWSWVTYNVVMRSRRCSSRSSTRMRSRSLASRLLSGSSNNSTFRLAHQRPRQGETLLLSAGKLGCHALFIAAQLHLSEGVADFLRMSSLLKRCLPTLGNATFSNTVRWGQIA